MNPGLVLVWLGGFVVGYSVAAALFNHGVLLP